MDENQNPDENLYYSQDKNLPILHISTQQNTEREKQLDQKDVKPNESLLVELAQGHPELYEKSNPLYMNNQHKSQIWESIAKKTGYKGCSILFFYVLNKFIHNLNMIIRNSN
jgi:hypothetical protein